MSAQNEVRLRAIDAVGIYAKMRKLCRFMKVIDNYNARLNEIQQLQHINQNQLKERAVRRNLEMMKKQIFVTEMQRK